MLLKFKNNQRRLYQQIVSRFRGHRHFPVVTRDLEVENGRLVRQRWAIENQWHWPRDTQLGEEAHRQRNRNGVQELALLRTLALNLLRCNGFCSIRAGLMAMAHDIKRMLNWVGVNAAEKG